MSNDLPAPDCIDTPDGLDATAQHLRDLIDADLDAALRSMPTGVLVELLGAA